MTRDPQDEFDRLARALRDAAPAPDPGRGKRRCGWRWKILTVSPKDRGPTRVLFLTARKSGWGS